MASIPDPVVGADGRPSIPGGTPALTPAVLSAGGKQIQAIGGSASGNPNETRLRYPGAAAGCRLHAHAGYPRWPDPNQQGEFHVRSADAGTPAKMNKAVASCSSRFPPSGWHLIVTPSGQ